MDQAAGIEEVGSIILHNNQIAFIIQQSRWLTSLNVSLASEAKQRVLAKKIVGDNITAGKGAFTFSMDKGGEEIKEVPFVYRPNLIATVSDYVEKHK